MSEIVGDKTVPGGLYTRKDGTLVDAWGNAAGASAPAPVAPAPTPPPAPPPEPPPVVVEPPDTEAGSLSEEVISATPEVPVPSEDYDLLPIQEVLGRVEAGTLDAAAVKAYEAHNRRRSGILKVL
jgi:hypothetical protein